MNSYFSRALKIAKSMKACGENMQESVIIANIMRSMTTKFNYVVCSIEESNNMDTMTIDELQSSLLVHKQRMMFPAEEERVMQMVADEKSGRGRGRAKIKGLSEAKEGEDKHSTRLRLNASNATSLDTFNMNVLCGKIKQIMLRWRIKRNKRMSSC